MRRTLTLSGTATPEVAWQRYFQLNQWSTWSPYILRVEPAGATLAADLHGLVHGPLGVAVPFTVTAVDIEARSWDWTVRVPLIGATLRLHHEVLTEKDGCRTVLAVEGPMPIVLGYLPIARLALGRLVKSGQ